jgi:hypothetical protein
LNPDLNLPPKCMSFLSSRNIQQSLSAPIVKHKQKANLLKTLSIF